ncbi:MAG: PHP domain-containing protein [Bacillota bacterium]
MKSGRADLHVHSTVSDGTAHPRELIEVAARAGLDCIALCDHDAAAPWQTVRDTARRVGICAISGVELGLYLDPEDRDRAACSGTDRLDLGEVHILAYGASTETGPLEEMLRKNRSDRRRRMDEMVQRLRRIGVDIEPEDVKLEMGGGSNPGRPHLARALVRGGYVGSVAEAFSEFLAPGKPGYVPRRRVSVEEGIGRVIGAGGLPFLAHPAYYDDPLRLIDYLHPVGIVGVEVLHRDHSMRQVAELLMHTRRRSLLPSGGSDYHGRANDPSLGDISVPTAWALDILGSCEEMSVVHDNHDA